MGARSGKPPGDVAKIQKRPPGVTALSFADFAAILLSAPVAVKDVRPDHTFAMLKAERFQIYADATAADLVGVVRNQSSKELSTRAAWRATGSSAAAHRT